MMFSKNSNTTVFYSNQTRNHWISMFTVWFTKILLMIRSIFCSIFSPKWALYFPTHYWKSRIVWDWVAMIGLIRLMINRAARLNHFAPGAWENGAFKSAFLCYHLYNLQRFCTFTLFTVPRFKKCHQTCQNIENKLTIAFQRDFLYITGEFGIQLITKLAFRKRVFRKLYRGFSYGFFLSIVTLYKFQSNWVFYFD